MFRARKRWANDLNKPGFNAESWLIMDEDRIETCQVRLHTARWVGNWAVFELELPNGSSEDEKEPNFEEDLRQFASPSTPFSSHPTSRAQQVPSQLLSRWPRSIGEVSFFVWTVWKWVI
jgi:hypothetical protein